MVVIFLEVIPGFGKNVKLELVNFVKLAIFLVGLKWSNLTKEENLLSD